MKKILSLVLLTLSFSGLRQTASAQVSITGNLPQNYTQNFDSFGTNDVVWTDNSVLPGWFIIKGDGIVTNLIAENGGLITSEVYNLGSDGNTDRTLGDSASIGEDTFYGARFVNNTGGTITNINVSYAGEQWRSGPGASASQTIEFLYRIGGTDFLATNTGWTAVSALNFASPQFNVNQIFDGNNPTNRVLVSGNINDTIAPGQEFWIRWADLDNAGEIDHVLGVDDVAITFNGINSLKGVTIDLKKPKTGKKLVVKTSKGLKKVKGFVISTSNTVSKVSYAAFGGTNSPTNLTFIAAATKVPKPNSKLAKKNGVDLIFNSTKDTKPGVGITTGPVTLLIKVEGGANNAEVATFTNVFTDVKIK